ncbi:metal-dependent hydrolase [Roseivivax sp. THAF40]|uniref:MBL fold metallo-hydrolase n=1 Tax=unclassified Roseivivax TaxID=2639302 RepID=UPI00126929D1|nr:MULTISPECIES: MBL fold metallo-hydrolase [unclassified Roseivivax]QFS84503.1 metal-dependent hydrolase [Roseivivax sp. THAF197b]QFT48331.1 metal-dependent hydrolase [Roseivivax sp. THAF40]
MTQTRRTFLVSAAATAAGTTIMPFAAMAAAHASNSFETDAGTITVHPVEHASFVLETPKGVIYVDTVGGGDKYADMPAADMVLITHEHGDHYNAETLDAVVGEDTMLVTNPSVYDMLSEAMQAKATAMANGDSGEMMGVGITAIPAHNTTEERMNFHPEGRDNGYVLDFDGFRIYVSGDTEVTDEMRALENIDVAFVCMNLPFTMDAEQAAGGVNAFQPGVVYPYHYRGRDGGTQDPEAFASMVEGSEVAMGEWYPNGLG